MKQCILRGALLLAVLLLCSCSPEISTVISSSQETATTVSCTIPPVLSDLMENLTGSSARDLISTAEIQHNLESHGIPVAACSISRNNEFILKTGRMAPVALPLPVAASDRSITVTITPEAMQHTVSLLPSETADTFDLLMAPVLTGEEMSPDEYCDLMAVVYGDSIADELKTSQLTLSLETPAPATLSVTKGSSVQTWNSKNRSLSHQFPVVNLLTLQETVLLTISW